MKVFLVLILVFLLPPLSVYAVDVGDEAPHFITTSLDGKKIDYSTFKGKKPLYLIFWATW